MRKRICDGILGMDVPNPEPRVALFLYRMNPEILKAIGDGVNGNMIVVHAFDGRGEKTGREVFDWALGADGAIDRTSYQTRRELAMLQCKYSLKNPLTIANDSMHSWHWPDEVHANLLLERDGPTETHRISDHECI
jgi:hypothetical protein